MFQGAITKLRSLMGDPLIPICWLTHTTWLPAWRFSKVVLQLPLASATTEKFLTYQPPNALYAPPILAPGLAVPETTAGF